MYAQIEGMISAEHAADSLVFHATNLADGIKRNDNSLIANRVACMKTLLGLLEQYAGQDDASEQAIEPPAGQVA